MKLDNPDLPELLRREIFHQLKVADPGGGLCTSLDGSTVFFGDSSIEDRQVVILADAYNVLGITNFLPPRKRPAEETKKRPARRRGVRK